MTRPHQELIDWAKLKRTIVSEKGYSSRIIKKMKMSPSTFHRYVEDFPEIDQLLEKTRRERDIDEDIEDISDIEQARKNRREWLRDEKKEVGNACLSMTRQLLTHHWQSKAHEKTGSIKDEKIPRVLPYDETSCSS